MYNSEKLRNFKRQTKQWASRVALRHRKTALYCAAHGVQRVTDYRPMSAEAVLACGCARSPFCDMKPEDREALAEFLSTEPFSIARNPRIAEWERKEV